MAKPRDIIWPMVTMPVLWVCLIAAGDHKEPRWVVGLIFAGWWVGVALYLRGR